jgi:hypothetical protein
MRWTIAVCLALAACSKPPPPRPPSPARIAELTAIMARQQDEQQGHGRYHRPKNNHEQELWKLASALGVVEKGDELLLLVVQNVYTRYDANFWNGYIWHYPYLNSRRAIALVDKILKDYPQTAARERALWLKAFALRCPPAPAMHEAETEFDVYRDQATWAPDGEAARKVLQEVAAMNGPFATKAKALAESVDLATLILPIDPDDPDQPPDADPRLP